MRTFNSLILIGFFTAVMCLPYSIHSQGLKISSGGNIAAFGNASMSINNGNFVNNGTYTKGTETVTLSGTTADTISGSTNTDFNNLLVTNTGGITTQFGLLTAATLNVSLGSKFIIDPGKWMTVSGSTSLNGPECIIIKSNATSVGSFIDNGITGTGTAKVERWVSTNGNYRWEYISSPVNMASSSLFTTATRGLWYANETINSWVSIPNTSPQNMIVMKGYARKYVNSEGDGDMVKNFSGALNTGVKSIPVTGTTISNVFDGYNLVGNPYPSTIDWNASVGWTKTNLDNAIYFRSNGNFGSFIANIGTNGGTQFIPSMQAFWVRVSAGQTSGTLGCNNNVRIHNAHNIYKSLVNNTLHLTATNSSNGLTDETYILFNADATDSFDGQYDAYKMFADEPTYPQLYTGIANDNISINSLGELTGERDVPLGFKTEMSGQFIITAGLVSSFTDNNNTVYLEDIQTGAYQNLSVNNTYQFTSGICSGFGRFIVHFNPLLTNIEHNAESKVQIYGYQNEIHLNSDDMMNGQVIVYDILGQIVVSKTVSESTSCVIKMDVASAVYLVKYVSKEVTVIRKVVINDN